MQVENVKNNNTAQTIRIRQISYICDNRKKNEKH